MGTSPHGQLLYDPQRIAALISTYTSNANDAEAMTGARLLRREADRAGVRLVDLFYRADIIAALDAQLKPVREMIDQAAFDAERTRAEEAETALAEREKQTRQIIDHYENELHKLASKQTQSHRNVGEFLEYSWGFPQWRLASLLIFLLAWIGVQNRYPQRWVEFTLAGAAVWLVLLWSAAEIDESGWTRLLIKLAFVCTGAAAAFAAPQFAIVMLALTAVIAVTKLINNLTELLMEVPGIAEIIGLFI